MTYELTIPLNRGSVEIEFDDADDLARKLQELDVPRVERLVAEALRAPREPAAKKGRATKRSAKKTTKKRAPRRRG